MDAKIGKFLDSIGAFFTGSGDVPWCDRDVIAGCQREVAEAATEEQKTKSIMSPLQAREKLYLLAVGHYRNGDYSRGRQLLDHCLEIEPDCRQALRLKKTVEDKIAKDGLIGIGIATTAVGLLIGGIAATVALRN